LTASMIRKGCTRTVIVVRRFALKLAFDKRGRRCNRFEANLFRCVDALRRAMLCPVLWCDPTGTALLMPTARPLTEPERDQLWKTDGFPDWDYMSGGDQGEPFKWKPSDWGWLNGQLVALDYSSPAPFD